MALRRSMFHGSYCQQQAGPAFRMPFSYELSELLTASRPAVFRRNKSVFIAKTILFASLGMSIRRSSTQSCSVLLHQVLEMGIT